MYLTRGTREFAAAYTHTNTNHTIDFSPVSLNPLDRTSVSLYLLPHIHTYIYTVPVYHLLYVYEYVGMFGTAKKRTDIYTLSTSSINVVVELTVNIIVG